MSERIVWKIRVQGYGTFDFCGTEQDADVRRIAKARWEKGNSMMWRADESREVDKFASQIARLFDAGKGAPYSLVKKYRKEKEGMKP